MSRLSLQTKRQLNLATLSKSLPSTDPNRYEIERRDYSRSNSDERFYKTKWWPTLMRIYDCRCALCGEDRDGIELDHFWIPKSHGGNLILRDRELGMFVNNGVPLCTACNRHKQESIMPLNEVQLARIAEANRAITAKINDVPVLDLPAKMHGYEPGDERRALGVPGLLRNIALLYKSNPNPQTLACLKKDIEDYLLTHVRYK